MRHATDLPDIFAQGLHQLYNGGKYPYRSVHSEAIFVGVSKDDEHGRRAWTRAAGAKPFRHGCSIKSDDGQFRQRRPGRRRYGGADRTGHHQENLESDEGLERSARRSRRRSRRKCRAIRSPRFWSSCKNLPNGEPAAELSKAPGTNGEIQAEPSDDGKSYTVALKGKFILTLVKWKEYDTMLPAQKKAWDDMIALLTAHEREHVAIAYRGAEKLIKTLTGLGCHARSAEGRRRQHGDPGRPRRLRFGHEDRSRQKRFWNLQEGRSRHFRRSAAANAGQAVKRRVRWS